MKRRNRLQALVCGAAIFAFAACTDVWDEHYQSSPELNAEENLWELISEDPELEEFEAFLRATKYDSLLMMSRNYTVWAPTDGSGCCDTAMLRRAMQSAEKDSLLEVYRKEIVENHIANFSHVAGDIRDQEDKKNYEKVLVLNGKSYHFEGSFAGGYKFSDCRLKTPNLVATNGVLHKLEGAVEFFPNIWEQLSKEEDLDSLWNFLKKDYKRTLNLNNSVMGPIVEGKQEILDSAWDISCRWFYEIGQLNTEDSSYTMYALSNNAWSEMSSLMKLYYNYSKNLVPEDKEDKRTSWEIRDSVVKEMMCRNLVFSNTVNKKYFDGMSDTLRSTTYRMFCDNVKLPDGTVRNEASAITDASVNGLMKEVQLSNGVLKIVDQVNYQPWTWGHDTIRIQGESLSSSERYKRPSKEGNEEILEQMKWMGFFRARQRNISVPRDSAFHNRISGARFGYFAGRSETDETTVNPVFNFYVDNVLSANYRISIVLLSPGLMEDADEGIRRLPNKFTADLEYLTADGGTATMPFEPVGEKHPNGTKYPTDDGRKFFLSDPTVEVDTIVLAECFTFPACEANLSRINSSVQVKAKLHIEDKMKLSKFPYDTPTIRVTGADGKTSNVPDPDKTKWTKFDNSYRIDEVIFEPLPADYISEN